MDISELNQTLTCNKPNLTRKERKALNELASNYNLIIAQADKGSTMTMRHRTNYINGI